ncbi:cysteine desulfurase [Kordiimonas sediminis]|uniref:Cysteine desulfurase n=1 Tax=Kordiimonas sediminis TaxID=1735581 RepID=A0A919AV27_9PROT|nr:cysteine desulfurase family protein [Kordiimonas sediminis]GHF27523.1 cysteine desulfurase [Kordiimonas sediminis]
MKKPVYLDYNATAPIRETVITSVCQAMSEVGNPSSVHAFGRRAKSIADEGREKVAALVGARARDIVFTASGTEANNAVLRSTGADHIIISATEHESAVAAAKASGKEVSVLPVSADGIVNLEKLEQLLVEHSNQSTLVSVIFANNETGVIQPISEIATVAMKHGARVHTDAVQAAGKIPLDMQKLGVQYMTLSAHKIGGPQGVGAIAMHPTAPLDAFIVGGGQELGRRSGTENVAGIAGFGEAAVAAFTQLSQMNAIATYRNKLETAVRSLCNTVIIPGSNTERLGNTSCIIMPGVKGETQVMHFDLNGVCISSGSACSSGKVKNSHVLTAMGFSDDEAQNSIRISLGYKTTEEDVDAAINAWESLYNRASR